MNVLEKLAEPFKPVVRELKERYEQIEIGKGAVYDAIRSIDTQTLAMGGLLAFCALWFLFSYLVSEEPHEIARRKGLMETKKDA